MCAEESASRLNKGKGSTMNYLLSILIIAVIASQTLIWHSLASIRDAIQQTNAIVLAACGTDDRPCQVAARRGEIELGEIMVRSRATDGFSCGLSRFNPCWMKTSSTTINGNAAQAQSFATGGGFAFTPTDAAQATAQTNFGNFTS